MLKFANSAFVAFAVLISTSHAHYALAADEPSNLIKYRQAIMKAIGGHMGALGAVAKGVMGVGR